MKQARQRLDILLVERGLFATRAKASAAVMAGQVLVQGRPALKAGAPTPADARLELLSPCPYVSRGGLKLEAALAHFALDVAGRICLDLGASTGGFSDCLLQKGASQVYAVDVGRGQLHDKLRTDPRVVWREKTHARELRPEWLSPRPEMAVIDVSFISLTVVLPFVLPCLAQPSEVLALIKPQFEVGPKLAPKGIVREAKNREIAVAKVRQGAQELGLTDAGLFESPVRGSKGNVEFFILLKSNVCEPLT